MKRLSALMLAACSVAAGAAEKPDDFAYAMPIAADGQEALYQVELPAALYRGVARADLRDVRVFNARGEAVPHAIRPSAASRTAKPEPVALPIFPLRGERGRGIEDLQVHVEKRPDGTVVNIRSGGKTAAARAAVLGYLLDASRIQQPIQALHFEWKALRDGFSGKVRIDGSDDLSRWNTLTRDASLLDLEFGGHRLEQKRVAFHPQRYKYLRLSWPAGQKDVELTAVRAEAVPGVVEPQRLWLALPAPLPGDNPGDYEYDSGGFFSFDRLRIELPQLNTLAQIHILVRNQPAEAWRPASGALVYRLRREGSELANPDIAMAGHGERYLMLRIDQKGGGIGSGAPVVHIGWRPQQLVFAARGEAPFRLAYGSHAAPAAAFPIASLIPGYNTDKELSVASATLGEQVTLAGAKRLSAPVDYRRWALWASLILGVAVLGWMAYRLSRQMPRDTTATEPPHSPDAHA
jgi:hypothetical protein